MAGLGGGVPGLHMSVTGPAVAAVTEAPMALGLSGMASCARGGCAPDCHTPDHGG